MTVDTTGLCREHSFESAEEVCRRCGGEYCEICLVFPFGVSKPFCKECAIAAGGVRAHVARQPMPRRDLRRKVKAFEARRQARAAGGSAPGDADADAPVLNDPLAPISTPSEPAPAPTPMPATVPAAAAPSAEQSAESSGAPTPPPALPAEEPADGVAPPIDWSQPFG